MRMLPLLLTCVAATTVSALDVNGDVSYLDRKLKPSWRFTSLASVLDDIAKQAERPMERSETIVAAQKDDTVCLVANERITIRDALLMIELSNDIHVKAEPLRLKIESAQDAKNQRRRMVNLHMRDWATDFIPHDLPGPIIGLNSGNYSGQGIFDVFGSIEMPGRSGLDPSEVADMLTHAADGATAEVRSGNIYVFATIEEEALMRKLLAERYALATRRANVRATFGLIGAADVIPTGILPRAQAAQVIAKLTHTSHLDAAAMMGQRVSSGSLIQQSGLRDIEVVNERLDPTIDILTLGRGIDVSVYSSDEFYILSHKTSWVEPLEPPRSSSVVSNASRQPKSATASVQTKDEDKPTSQEVRVEEPTNIPGERAVLSLPSLWSWIPRGDIALPIGQAVVLCSPHPQGRAVIIWEVLP